MSREARSSSYDGTHPVGHRILEPELQRQQLENHTPPCGSSSELDDEVRRNRRVAAEAARAVGVDVAALATSPRPARPVPTRSGRYQRMAKRFGVLPDEQLTCGCHVHVQIDSTEEGVGVIDRIRVWLPVLQALATNSPFWDGRDTGYAGFRSQVWGRWPSAGPTEVFGSHAAYETAVQVLLDTDTLLDPGMIYFDARVSRTAPTVEVRVCDVCLFPEDIVLLAALTHSLVETAAREWRDGRPASRVGSTPCGWQLGGQAGTASRASWFIPAPGVAAADAVVADLVDHVRPALTDAGDLETWRPGDLETVRERLAGLMARGTGARVQREVHRHTRDLAAVVALAVERTVP